MAEPSDLVGEVVAASEELSKLPPPPGPGRDEWDRARRAQALSFRLAGLSWEQIGQRLNISPQGATDMVNRTLTRAENRLVEEMRDLEGQRLDRAQLAIWSKVLDGDPRAVDTFLRISARRAKLFGLDAPTKVALSLEIRQEMDEALARLEKVILGEVISGVDEPDYSGYPGGAAGAVDGAA